jgi:hypothetical protein
VFRLHRYSKSSAVIVGMSKSSSSSIYWLIDDALINNRSSSHFFPTLIYYNQQKSIKRINNKKEANLLIIITFFINLIKLLNIVSNWSSFISFTAYYHCLVRNLFAGVTPKISLRLFSIEVLYFWITQIAFKSIKAECVVIMQKYSEVIYDDEW